MQEQTELVTYSDKWLSVQTNEAITPQKMSAQLLVLQTAFPAVVRNFDKYEFQALQSLWYDIFKNVPEDITREAIRRFIINDRKGFFPSPGQIVQYVEQIADEQETARKEKEFVEMVEAQRKAYEKERQLIAAGETCANCRYCHSKTPPPIRYYAHIDVLFEEKTFPPEYYCAKLESSRYEGNDGKRKLPSKDGQDLRCNYFERKETDI